MFQVMMLFFLGIAIAIMRIAYFRDLHNSGFYIIIEKRKIPVQIKSTLKAQSQNENF